MVQLEFWLLSLHWSVAELETFTFCGVLRLGVRTKIDCSFGSFGFFHEESACMCSSWTLLLEALVLALYKSFSWPKERLCDCRYSWLMQWRMATQKDMWFFFDQIAEDDWRCTFFARIFQWFVQFLYSIYLLYADFSSNTDPISHGPERAKRRGLGGRAGFLAESRKCLKMGE